MAKPSELTPLEWEIMDVVWRLGGRPCVRDVLEAAYPDGSKAYTTVQTVMNNLESKGYLSKEKIGLVNFYTPIEPRREAVQGETRRFGRDAGGERYSVSRGYV